MSVAAGSALAGAEAAPASSPCAAGSRCGAEIVPEPSGSWCEGNVGAEVLVLGGRRDQHFVMAPEGGRRHEVRWGGMLSVKPGENGYLDARAKGVNVERVALSVKKPGMG